MIKNDKLYYEFLKKLIKQAYRFSKLLNMRNLSHLNSPFSVTLYF